jgi:hypothetical protein
LLAYVFWHRPRPGIPPEDYERAQRAFHVRLGIESASFRLERLPFDPGAGYEDWYLVETWAHLGALNAAAIDDHHRPEHDAAAALVGPGWGAVYACVRGEHMVPEGARWLEKPRGRELDAVLAELGGPAPVWQRQMVLGPAPELCVAGGEPRKRIA